MKPGLYPDIPFKDYLAIPAVSNSYLSKMDKCPAAAKVEQEETPSLILGRAVHKVVLEGSKAFLKEFAVAPDLDKRTKAGKEEFAAFQSANEGKQILTKDEGDKVLVIGNAVFKHPFAKKLLAENVTEQTIIWEDRDTGLLCKGRPDCLPDEDKMVIVDLKTARGAGEKEFTRSVVSYGYAKGAAFYHDGYGAATGIYLSDFVLIAVEPEEPYRVEVYVLDDEFVGWGRQEYKRLLALEKRCRDEGKYPHYQNEGITTLFKPTYL